MGGRPLLDVKKELRPVWRIFRKRGDEHLDSHGREHSTAAELVFYRTLDVLSDSPLPADPVEASERALQILHASEREVLGHSLVEISGRFGRLWYDFIARHDVLPVGHQLDPESLLIARDLVTAFSQGSTRTRAAARKVLQLVDTAFQAGNLALCEVLLALFETEAETQRHNERNVFFDRYTRRMFHQRKRLLTPALVHEFRTLAQQPVGEEWVKETLLWLSNRAGITFCTRQVDAEMTARAALVDEHSRQVLRSVMRVAIPYERFRPIDAQTMLPEVAQRMTLRMLGAGPIVHMRRTLEAAYFVALSSGKNETDELLFDLDPWLRGHLDQDSPTLLGRIHRASRTEDKLIRDAIDLALNEEAGSWVFGSRFTHQQLSSILTALPRKLRDLDLQSVPEGLYDLEQFIGDIALDVPHRRLSRRLRLCQYL